MEVQSVHDGEGRQVQYKGGGRVCNVVCECVFFFLAVVLKK